MLDSLGPVVFVILLFSALILFPLQNSYESYDVSVTEDDHMPKIGFYTVGDPITVTLNFTNHSNETRILNIIEEFGPPNNLTGPYPTQKINYTTQINGNSNTTFSNTFQAADPQLFVLGVWVNAWDNYTFHGENHSNYSNEVYYYIHPSSDRDIRLLAESTKESADAVTQQGNFLILTAIATSILAAATFVLVIFARRSTKLMDQSIQVQKTAEDVKSAKQARHSHFNRIKNRCILPLLEGIRNVERLFYVDEMTRYDKQQLLRQEQEGGTDIAYLKLWVSITNNAYGIDQPFERLLYVDLKNHYPELKDKFDTVQKFLDDNYPVYYKKRIELIFKLFAALEKSNTGKEDQSKISVAVTVGLLTILDYDKMNWPNLFRVSSNDGTLELIKDIIKQKEISELGNLMKEITAKSLSMLSDLRDSLDKLVKFEGELKGDCGYL